MSEIGKRIRNKRKELGISSDDLAQAIGVSRTTIFRYENGDIEKIPSETIKKLSNALHTSPAYLIGWEDNLNTENAKLMASLTTDAELIKYIKKIKSLNQNHKYAIFDMIDYLYGKEGH